MMRGLNIAGRGPTVQGRGLDVGPVGPDVEIMDDFEDGDLAEWDDTSGLTIENSTVWEGSYSVDVASSGGTVQGQANEGGALSNYFAKGYKHTYYLYLNSTNADNRFMWGTDNLSYNSSGFEMTWRPKNGRVELNIDGNSQDQSGVSAPSGEWMKGEIDWAADDTITARFYWNGVDTLQATLSMTTTAYSQGSFGFGTRDSGQYVDYIFREEL